jgi:hypothetical protein
MTERQTLYQTVRDELTGLQLKLDHQLTALLVRRLGFLHGVIPKTAMALFVNGTLVAVLLAIYLFRQQIVAFLFAQPPLLLAFGLFLLLLLLSTLLYKKAGLIQLVLLMAGLGIGYGFGSRFRPERKPRCWSDYDLGLFARHSPRLNHKKDPRLLVSRASLMALTWRKVDIKHYPLSTFIEKKGVLLVSLWGSQLLLPFLLALAFLRAAHTRASVSAK